MFIDFWDFKNLSFHKFITIYSNVEDDTLKINNYQL